jgi:hypothetical protein
MTAETTEADLIPSTTPKPPSGSPMHQVARLKEYLAANFPDAAIKGEHAADTAIRILQGMSTGVADAVAPRCLTQYCNKPATHTGEHGWVQYG